MNNKITLIQEQLFDCWTSLLKKNDLNVIDYTKKDKKMLTDFTDSDDQDWIDFNKNLLEK